MFNEKEIELLKIISKLKQQLKEIDIGIPLEEFYRQVKNKGIYQSDRFISEKLKKFERLGIVKIKDWNIVEINYNDT